MMSRKVILWLSSFSVVSCLRLNKVSTAPTDHQWMYRDAMTTKLRKMAKEDPRVMVMEPFDFNRRGWVSRLPENGAIIFVVDHAFRSSDHSVFADMELLENPKILALGAEDYRGLNHPKVVKLPIGMESTLMTGGYGDTLDVFLNAMKNPVPTKQRLYKVQSDAQLHKFGRRASGEPYDDRGDMEKGVQLNAIDDWYKKGVDMKSHFRDHVSQAEFALCPEGNGIDAHRFYHAYALRTRCIVKRNEISDLHESYPGTIVVDDWKEVTAENIEKWSKEEYTYKPEMSQSDWWIEKVLQKANPSPNMALKVKSM